MTDSSSIRVGNRWLVLQRLEGHLLSSRRVAAQTASAGVPCPPRSLWRKLPALPR